jgi:hypothetical protein
VPAAQSPRPPDGLAPTRSGSQRPPEDGERQRNERSSRHVPSSIAAAPVPYRPDFTDDVKQATGRAQSCKAKHAARFPHRSAHRLFCARRDATGLRQTACRRRRRTQSRATGACYGMNTKLTDRLLINFSPLRRLLPCRAPPQHGAKKPSVTSDRQQRAFFRLLRTDCHDIRTWTEFWNASITGSS